MSSDDTKPELPLHESVSELSQAAQAALKAETKRNYWQRLKDWIWGYDFFVSYHWDSGGVYAVNLAQMLRSKGFDVFLDRADYASGDDWKRMGLIALRNTQRLVLVATREAVTISKPVQHEVEIFTARGRQVIPIIFGDRFDDIDRSDYPTLACLPDSQLYIDSGADSLAKGPTTENVKELMRTHKVLRRRNFRALLTLIPAIIVISFAAFATYQWQDARVAESNALKSRNAESIAKTKATQERDNAIRQKNIAIAQSSRALANLATSEGQRSLDSDPALAVALASRSLTLSPTNRARRLLFDAVRALPVYNELRSADASKQKEKVAILHSASPLRLVRFAPSERQILIVRTNGTVSVWDLDTHQATSFAEKVHDVRDVLVARSANRVAFLSVNKVIVYSFDENGTACLSQELFGDFVGAKFSNDGDLLVAFEKTKLVAVSLNTGERIDVAVEQVPLGVAIARNNSRCAVLLKDGELVMFSLPDGGPLHRGKSTIPLSSMSAIDFLMPHEKLLKAKDALQSAKRNAEPKEIEAATLLVETAEKALREAYQDALGLPIPPLTISGYATQSIMSLGSPKHAEERDVAIEFTADDAAVFVAVADSSSLDVEVWNAGLTDRAFHRKGLFSKANLRSDGKMIAIAGPGAIQTFAISGGQKLKVVTHQFWNASMEAERLGEPVAVAFSHHGEYVATVHSPSLMLQGSRSSSASLWYSEEVDSRDDNTHRGHRLRPYSARIDSIAFSSQDDRVLTTDVDGTVRVWKIVSGEKLFSDQAESPLYVQYLFSGLSYVPEETVDLLRTQFKSDSDMIAAARKICRRSLSPEEEKAIGIIDLDSSGPLSLPKAEPLRYAWRPAAWYAPQAKVHAPLPGNEVLNDLVQDILKRDIEDNEVGLRYAEAVKRDILLLSGAQNRWAAGILADVKAANCAEAAIVMSLSGDRETVADLQKARTPSRTVTDLKAIDWAIRFLKRQGRDLSLSEIAKLDRIQTLEVIDLCCWPQCAEAELSPKNLDLTYSTEELKQAASRHHAHDPNRSLASYAFALAVTGRDRGYLLKMIAEFLELQNDLRNARRFAEASRIVDGENADVENLLGNLDDADGKLDEAIVHYRRSLELGRADGWPEHNLGKVFEKKGDLVAAETHFRAALVRRDTVRRPSELAQFLNAAAWFLVTRFETDAGKMGEALRFSEEANEITKHKNANYLDTLALCKFTIGNVDEAIQIEEKALTILKNDDPLAAEITRRLTRFKKMKQ